MSQLAKLDLANRLSDEEYDKRVPELQARLHDLHAGTMKKEVPSVVVFEGWDASGKGGAIRRLTPTLDPRAYEVVPVAAPRGEEAERHYLWRFWRHAPRAGALTIFDRSWYGRVLVERVERICSPGAWGRAYGEISEFERELAESGTVIVKFWLHISPEEQLRRFRDREGDRHKRYKIGPEDWRNRRKWRRYEQAVEDMVRRTHRPRAPWTLVEAEDKRFARVKILETVVEAWERGLDGPSPGKRFRRIERRLKRLAKG